MQWQIAMVWRRGRVSFLEQLCMRSFLDVGHPVVLYCNGPVEGLPEGVTCRALSEVDGEGGDALLPYRILAATENTIWVEPDTCCLAPLKPEHGYLLGWEDEAHVGTSVLALPPDSEALARLLTPETHQTMAPDWTALGPQVLTRVLRETGGIGRALPVCVFNPVGFADREALLSAGTVIHERAQALHLFAPRLSRRLAEVEQGLPDPESPLGQLLLKHGIDPVAAPLDGCPEPERQHAFARRYRRHAPVKTRPLDDVVAVALVSNSAPELLDWIAYHHGIGVSHFLIYTDNCTDETPAMLDRLAEQGLVTTVAVPEDPDKPPIRWSLEDAATHPATRRADAVVVLDSSEYINIHAGEGRIADLFEEAGDPDLISMTRRVFEYSRSGRRPIPERCTQAVPYHMPSPPEAWAFRTIFRREAPFNAFGAHRPRRPNAEMPAWTNGSGRQMPARYLKGGWRSDVDSVGYDLVTLNHYSEEVEFKNPQWTELPRPGPDPGPPGRNEAPDRGPGRGPVMDRATEEDRSILPRLTLARDIRARFAEDPILGPLHARAMARLGAGSVFDIRKEPPAIGKTASAQFDALMSRVQKQQDRLTKPANPPRDKDIVIVTSMKNEGAFILEWIAYHLSIGVTHFLVYTNDCDDPTNAILDRLAHLGHVTRRDNPFNRAAGQKPQRGALNDAIRQPIVRNADWVGVIDVDEFINIHVGDGTLPALFEAAGHPNVLSMTWRFFGNRGVHAYEDRWQTEQFTACAPLYIPKPRLGWGFKSFFRPDGPFEKIGVHRPLKLDETRAGEVRWVNGAGRVMPERLAAKAEWFSRKDTIGYDLVTLNHYVLRSAESFLVKRQRGRINHVDQDQGLAYWCHRNYATETDRSIVAHLPRAHEVLARLFVDAELSRLHREAVAWHRERITALMAEPDYRALYDAITNSHLPDAIWREQTKREPEMVAAE